MISGMGNTRTEDLDEQHERNGEEKTPKVEHPVRRDECQGGSRPCPLVGCKWNLYLSVRREGTIHFTFPHREPDNMETDASCVMDVVDANPDGITLEEAGRRMNLTRERIRQIEVKIMRKIHRSPELRQFVEAVAARQDSIPEDRRRNR